MVTETLEAELQKQLLRRTRKLQYIIANRERLKRHFRKIDSVPQLLSLSRLTDREERMSDAEFDSLNFQFSAGRIQSKLSANRLAKRLVWEKKAA